MEYTEVRFSITPFTEDNADWVVAEIESLGFDSFFTEGDCLKAYIRKGLFSREALDASMQTFEGFLEIKYEVEDVPQQNWNQIWESQFSPIVVDGACTVKATFHNNLPDTRYNVVIDPKMAFGTGHHQTTYLMISSIMRENVSGKRVLDMGCGTGILAILAAMMGASVPVNAVDIDDVAAESALENAALNSVAQALKVRCGDAHILQDEEYDMVFANINRNILMQDIPVYVQNMADGAVLLVSGFYQEDVPLVVAVARKCGLDYVSESSRDNWAVVKFVKNIR